MSSIRVNPKTLPDLLSALAQTRQQENTATLQLATGSRINQPSDDPAGAAQMVSNCDLGSQADGFLRSITSVNGLLQTADSTLSSVVTALQRAISLGVQGANGTLSNADVFQSVADLITALQTNSGIGNAVAAVRGAFDHVTSQRVFYGNAVNQLDAQQNYLNSEKVDLSTAADSISGADIAQTAATLNQAEVALNAELAAMEKISQNSLFDYLK